MREEERLVVAIVEFRDHDRTADGEAEVVAPLGIALPAWELQLSSSPTEGPVGSLAGVQAPVPAAETRPVAQAVAPATSAPG